MAEGGWRNSRESDGLAKRLLELAVIGLVTVYCAGFFLCSSYASGSFRGSKLSLRVFSAQWQIAIWKPFLLVERTFHSEEFDWLVPSGAIITFDDPSDTAPSD